MLFFTKLFKSLSNKSSVNFNLNIFFIKQMFSINVKHTLLPHYFLPLKTLKIKFLANQTNEYIYTLLYLIIFMFILISLLMFKF